MIIKRNRQYKRCIGWITIPDTCTRIGLCVSVLQPCAIVILHCRLYYYNDCNILVDNIVAKDLCTIVK